MAHIVRSCLPGENLLTCESISSRLVPESCSVTSSDEMSALCPSREWQNIRDYMYVTKSTLPTSYSGQYGETETPFGIEMPDTGSTRRLTIKEDQSYIGFGPRPLVATTQQAVVADALTNTGALWFLSLTNVTAIKGHGRPLSDQSDAYHTIENDYQQPYGTIVCIPDSISSRPDSVPISFPRLPNANPAFLSTGNVTYKGCLPGTQITAETLAHSSLTRDQIYNLPSSPTDFAIEWVDLDSDRFNGSSVGAVVLAPRSAPNATQDVILCNLSAGWGTSSLSMQTEQGGTDTVKSQVVHRDRHITSMPSIQQTNIPPSEMDDDAVDYFDFHLPYYPRQSLNISKEWAKYLSPTVSGTNTTVLNLLLQQQFYACSPRVSTETALVSLMVNGLAKIGAGSQLQGNVRTVGPDGEKGLDGNYWLSGKGNVFQVDNPSKDWIKFHVDSTLEGYGYNAYDTAPRLAIAILTIYCLLAIGHLVYAVTTGKPLPTFSLA